MTKIFNRLSVRELVLILGVSVMGMVSVVGVMAEVDESVEQGMEMMAAYNQNVQHPSCLDNYSSLPKSNVRKENVDWNLNDFPSHIYNQYTQGLQQFIDFNGDGLPDYIYFWKTSFNTSYGALNNETSCILLNNGQGWDIAYRCVSQARNAVGGGYEMDYYGDCADVENSTL